MARTVATGIQDFKKIIEEDVFYVDKTAFISDWWNTRDDVTLITRPRRFGKTLNMSMLECFFSTEYADRKDYFSKLEISKDEKIMNEQGQWPVIFFTLAEIKSVNYGDMIDTICRVLKMQFSYYAYLLNSDRVLPGDRKILDRYINESIGENEIAQAVKFLCKCLEAHHGKKVLIFLDEYDTPMQEAYVSGYWDEAVSFFRGFFNSTFKTNSALHRAVITGITRISKESLFSDMNNLKVVSTTTPLYETSFGFTEDEVFAALEEQGFSEGDKEHAKICYDGFTFGRYDDIYNPWSVIGLLSERSFKPFWINTSSNSLVGKLIREGSASLKDDFGELLEGKSLLAMIEEEVVFNQLDGNTDAIWGLLVASGYLRIIKVEYDEEGDAEYTITFTNAETRNGMRRLVRRWFGEQDKYGCNSFVKALLKNNLKEMNIYMNHVMRSTISFFDVGGGIDSPPEKFYHGFVLRLMVELTKTYHVRSNRESGYGRYDVMLIPRDVAENDGYVLEFKVNEPDEGEDTLEATVAEAKKQIKEKAYATELEEQGLPKERIHEYGFAFSGKKVLIG